MIEYILLASCCVNVYMFWVMSRMQRAGFQLMRQYEETWVRYQKVIRRAPDWLLRREFRDRMTQEGRAI